MTFSLFNYSLGALALERAATAARRAAAAKERAQQAAHVDALKEASSTPEPAQLGEETASAEAPKAI